jgi:hypothetical protein
MPTAPKIRDSNCKRCGGCGLLKGDAPTWDKPGKSSRDCPDCLGTGSCDPFSQSQLLNVLHSYHMIDTEHARETMPFIVHYIKTMIHQEKE